MTRNAFPRPVGVAPDGSLARPADEGMSLREWYAGMALAGLATLYEQWYPADNGTVWLAHQAFEMADAMLAEAKRRSR